MKTNQNAVSGGKVPVQDVLSFVQNLRALSDAGNDGEVLAEVRGDYCKRLLRRAAPSSIPANPGPSGEASFPALFIVADGAEALSVDLVHDAGDLDWKRRKVSDASADAFSVHLIPLSLVLAAPAANRIACALGTWLHESWGSPFESFPSPGSLMPDSDEETFGQAVKAYMQS